MKLLCALLLACTVLFPTANIAHADDQDSRCHGFSYAVPSPDIMEGRIGWLRWGGHIECDFTADLIQIQTRVYLFSPGQTNYQMIDVASAECTGRECQSQQLTLLPPGYYVVTSLFRVFAPEGNEPSVEEAVATIIYQVYAP